MVKIMSILNKAKKTAMHVGTFDQQTTSDKLQEAILSIKNMEDSFKMDRNYKSKFEKKK